MQSCIVFYIHKPQASDLQSPQSLLPYTAPKHTNSISMFATFLNIRWIKHRDYFFGAILLYQSIIEAEPAKDLFKTTPVTFLCHPTPPLHVTEYIPAIHSQP